MLSVSKGKKKDKKKDRKKDKIDMKYRQKKFNFFYQGSKQNKTKQSKTKQIRKIKTKARYKRIWK